MKAQRTARFAVLAVASSLAFAVVVPSPSEARPRPSVQERLPRAERIDLRSALPFLQSLWIGLWAKEGVSIDPNGNCGLVVSHGAPIPADRLDEGCSIDPNGSH
jgi:hypothetical protein